VGDHVTIGAQSGAASNIQSNQVLFGSPAIEIKQAMKAYIALRYLPEIRTDVARLKKELEALKNK